MHRQKNAFWRTDLFWGRNCPRVGMSAACRSKRSKPKVTSIPETQAMHYDRYAEAVSDHGTWFANFLSEDPPPRILLRAHPGSHAAFAPRPSLGAQVAAAAGWRRSLSAARTGRLCRRNLHDPLRRPSCPIERVAQKATSQRRLMSIPVPVLCVYVCL